jgi:hypothetical protein
MRAKHILLSIILLTFSFISNAQKRGVHIGIKAGANINQISGKSFSDEFSFGYHAGAFATIALNKKFSIQPEVLFNQVQVDTTSKLREIYGTLLSSSITKIKLTYLSIPILINYKPSKLITLQVGPQFGIMMDQNKDLLQNGQNAFKTGDLGLLGGIQLSFSSFRVYGRYVVGLNNVNDIKTPNADSWKTKSIQIGIGLKLF